MPATVEIEQTIFYKRRALSCCRKKKGGTKKFQLVFNMIQFNQFEPVARDSVPGSEIKRAAGHNFNQGLDLFETFWCTHKKFLFYFK